MAYDAQQLLQMTNEQLTSCFRAVPRQHSDGQAKGTAIIAPGTRFSQEIRRTGELVRMARQDL